MDYKYDKYITDFSYKNKYLLRWIAKEMTLKHETRDRLKAEVKANTAIQF